MAAAALAMAGIGSAADMPLGLLPAISPSALVVSASYLGLPAAEMSDLVAARLEDSLSSLRGLERAKSVSRDGRTIMTLQLRWGEDMGQAAARAMELVDAAYPSLPAGAEKPVVAVRSAVAEPLVVLGVASRTGDQAAARRLADRELRARLRRIRGMGDITLVGGRESEAAVSLDVGKAAVLGLAVADVARSIAQEAVDVPAGSVREGGLELVAIAKGRPATIDELGRVVLYGPHGPYRLSDVAELGDRMAARRSLFVAGGREAVGLELYITDGTDPVAAAAAIRRSVEGMVEDFSTGFDITLEKDGSIAVSESLGDLAVAGAVGCAAAALVIFAFLRDMKASLLVASTIPLSVAAAAAALDAFGMSLNGMSLGGVSLAVGMVSDNAVVVMNALHASFSSRTDRPDASAVADVVMGTVQGTFGSAVTTIVVFVPVALLPGALGELYGNLAVAITASVVAGWLLAVCAIPAGYRALWSGRGIRKRRGAGLERRYGALLRKAIRRPVVPLAAAALLAVVGTGLLATRPLAFLPDEAAREAVVRADFPAGTTLEAMADEAARLCLSCLRVEGVTGAYGRAGAETDDTLALSDESYVPETLLVTCSLSGDAEKRGLLSRMESAGREALGSGARVTARFPRVPAERALGLDGSAAMVVRAADRRSVEALACRLEAAVRSAAGPSLASMTRAPAGERPRITMLPLREPAARLGLSLSGAAGALRSATDGVVASSLVEGGVERGIVVFAAGAGTADGSGSLDGLRSLPLPSGNGSRTTMSAVADFRLSSAGSAALRVDRSDALYVEAAAAAGRERELRGDLRRAVAELAASGGATVAMADGSAFATYGIAMASSAALVALLLYLTLGAQFESFLMPLLVMPTIPLALAGVGPVLALAGAGLDSGSILGLIVLAGVVVDNAIVLYEASVSHRRDGSTAAAAACLGASERVRPILITTATTLVALVPVALSPSGGAQRAMSMTMLGGILASTALSLFVSPVLFAAAWKKGGERRAR